MIIKKLPRTSLKLAKVIAKIASDIKAENITVLDMRKAANFCDYFVLCSGNSSRQVRSIAEAVDEKFEELGEKIRFKQGVKEGKWVLLDLGTVVLHVFNHETRGFYGLDYLWKEAKKVSWEE